MERDVERLGRVMVAPAWSDGSEVLEYEEGGRRDGPAVAFAWSGNIVKRLVVLIFG
jgi:hypothetical protein